MIEGKYKDINVAFAECRKTIADVFKEFSASEKKAFLTMSPDEIDYVMNDCYIKEYVEHINRCVKGESIGMDKPVPAVFGTPLQLERYKICLQLTLIDYMGIKYCYPQDFALDNREVLDELRYFSGILVIRVPKGSSSTDKNDKFKSELISGLVAIRRNSAFPTVILMEEKIAGKLCSVNEPNPVTKYIYFSDATKFSTSYDKAMPVVKDETASRQTVQQVQTHQYQERVVESAPVQTTNYEQPKTYQYKGNKGKGNSGRTCAKELKAEESRHGRTQIQII